VDSNVNVSNVKGDERKMSETQSLYKFQEIGEERRGGAGWKRRYIRRNEREGDEGSRRDRRGRGRQCRLIGKLRASGA
jgi:hypothetical protein